MARTTYLLLLALVVVFGYAQAADRKLAFALKQRNLGLIEKIFWERSDPSHADYGKYVAPFVCKNVSSSVEDGLWAGEVDEKVENPGFISIR